MINRALTTLGVSLALLPGCYLLHGRSGAEDGPDATTRTDAGASELRDVGVAPVQDAGPPLPPEPDPDLGPDARPSDYPDADDWVDPPALGEDSDCCVLGPPMLITSRDEGTALAYEPPRIEWGPGVWGLLVTRHFSRPAPEAPNAVQIYELSAVGEPLGDPHVFDAPASSGDDPGARALRYAEGRWAVAVTGAVLEGNLLEMHARLFDRELVPASEWLPIGVAAGWLVDLARLSHGDRWLGVGATRDTLSVSPFGELGVDPRVEHAVSESSAVEAVGLRSRVAVLLSRTAESAAHDELLVVGPPPGYAVLGRVELASRYGRLASLAGLRDLVVAAGIEGGHVSVEVIDPFALEGVAGPRSIGDVPVGGPNRGAVSVVGSSKFGLAGVCYGVTDDMSGRGTNSRIEFRLVGPDGVPRGRAVTVVESPFRGSVVNCAVGTDDVGFLIGWWNGSELWVRRVDVAR